MATTSQAGLLPDTNLPSVPPDDPADGRLKREREEQFRLVRVQSYNWGTFHGLLKLDVSSSNTDVRGVSNGLRDRSEACDCRSAP